MEMIESQNPNLQSHQENSKYYELLNEFRKYKESSISQKESMKKQLQKCKQQLQKFMNKLDKRVDSRINQQKAVNNHHLAQQQSYFKIQIQKHKTLSAQKDNLIEQLRNLLRMCESEKRQFIENSTKMILEINQGYDSKQQKELNMKDNTQKELLKMYQFLMQQNNDLKKQIYILKRNNINASFVAPKQGKQDKSIANIAETKIKSATVYSSKNQNISMNKSVSSRQEQGKDRTKKVPKSKNAQR